MATLSTAFGMLAGLLSAIGIYGLISYLVARRELATCAPSRECRS